MDMAEYVELVRMVKGKLGCSVLDAVRVVESGVGCGVKIAPVQQVVVDGAFGIGDLVWVKPVLELGLVKGVMPLGPERSVYMVHLQASLEERLCESEELEKWRD